MNHLRQDSQERQMDIKKSRLQFPTQTCAFSNTQVGFTLGKDLHVLELQIFFDSKFICVCDSYCSFIGMSPFSRKTETLAMIKKKSITITRKTCLELVQLVPRKLCTKYNQEQIQKSLFKLTSSSGVLRLATSRSSVVAMWQRRVPSKVQQVTL